MNSLNPKTCARKPSPKTHEKTQEPELLGRSTTPIGVLGVKNKIRPEGRFVHSCENCLMETGDGAGFDYIGERFSSLYLCPWCARMYQRHQGSPRNGRREDLPGVRVALLVGWCGWEGSFRSALRALRHAKQWGCPSEVVGLLARSLNLDFATTGRLARMARHVERSASK